MLILQKELKIRSFFISRTLYNFSRYVFVSEKYIYIPSLLIFRNGQEEDQPI